MTVLLHMELATQLKLYMYGPLHPCAFTEATRPRNRTLRTNHKSKHQKQEQTIKVLRATSSFGWVACMTLLCLWHWCFAARHSQATRHQKKYLRIHTRWAERIAIWGHESDLVIHTKNTLHFLAWASFHVAPTLFPWLLIRSLVGKSSVTML